MGSRHDTAAPLAVCFLLLAVALPAQQANITERSRTGSIRNYDDVRVTSDDLDGVKAKQGRGSISIKASNIVSFEWIKVPESYKNGRTALKDGDFGSAARALRESLDQERSYPWLPVYANWYLGEALRRVGDVENALAAYEAMLKANARCRQAPDAYVVISEIRLRTGDTAGARMALQDLGKVAGSDDRFQLQVKLGLARIELKTGDLEKAKGMLEQVVSGAGSHADIANLARLEIGNVLVRQQAYDKAEKHFSSILDSGGDDADIIAGASNGLGDCQYAQKNYADAMYTYSKVYTLFVDRSDQAGRVAHALYFGGRSFRLQAGIETDAAKKKLLLKHGNDVLRRVAKDFAGTEYGRLAKEER